MSNTQTVYRFDSAGYYIGTSLAQFVGDNLLLPNDCTETEPKLKDGYWSKWNGSKWTNEKIPTSCAECIEKNLTCISNGSGQHNYEVKSLFESLVAADSEHYKIVVSSDFVEQIEEIPAPTPEEQEQKESEEKELALQAAIEELGKEMAKADLAGDEEWKADLRAEYEALIMESEG